MLKLIQIHAILESALTAKQPSTDRPTYLSDTGTVLCLCSHKSNICACIFSSSNVNFVLETICVGDNMQS
jgi:hypothetical protein